jgi:hypothetical protein
MAVNKGLKTLSESSPNFSNATTLAKIQSLVEDSTTNFASKTFYLMAQMVQNEVLTVTNKDSIIASLETQSYINIGMLLEDLNLHTQVLLSGAYGEAEDSDVQDPPTFVDHLNMVVDFESTIPSLFGVTADSLNKGINGHFGTLAGLTDALLDRMKEDVDFITTQSLPEDTAYQNAVQALSDYIETLYDSTAFNAGTFSGLLTNIETAASNFDTVLSAGIYAERKARLSADKLTLVAQINLEQNNIRNIVTYSNTLVDTTNYSSLAGNATANALLVRTSQNTNWRSYFENYASNLALDNPLYNGPIDDSTSESIIDSVLKMRGLPDVTDYVDLESVAAKAIKDNRMASQLAYAGIITEPVAKDIIKKACQLLNLTVDNRDSYAQSKSLLENMTQYDRDTVQNELNLYNDVNTLS